MFQICVLREMGGGGLSRETEPLLRISQEALGELVGISRKTVNVCLGAFEKEGLVRRGYGTLALRDIEGLERASAR